MILFDIKEIFFDKHKRSYKNLSNIMKKYQIKLVILEIWNGFPMEIFILLSAMGYVTYEIIVRGWLSIGIYIAMIAAIGGISTK